MTAYRLHLGVLLRNGIEALPLPVFLLYVHFAKPTISPDWRGPYFVSSLIGVLSMSLMLYERRPLNRIYLSLNLYFLSGALGLATQWTWLNQLYGRTEATAMLVWIAVIGALCSLFTKAGFIGVVEESKKTVYAKSLLLLVVSVGAAIFSWHFRGSPLWSAYLPFIVLFGSQGILRAVHF